MTPAMPTLLLVEDDPAEARLIVRAMDKIQMPARVAHVRNGDEAVAYLSGEAAYGDRTAHPLPRLVLMDLKLPRRSGLEVLQWMRTQKSGIERIPVVMLSSSQHGADIRRAYEYGVNSYLVKPDSSDKMLSMLASVKEYWFSHNQAPLLEEESV